MSILTFLYDLIIGPIELLLETIFSVFYTSTYRVGPSIVALSVAVNLLVFPLYRRADAMQEEERARLEKLKPGVDHIKKVFKGDERFMMLQTYYRQNNYKQYYSLRGSLSLLLQIPFFIAAYNFLSNLFLLNGASYKFIPDLGKPDGLLSIAGIHINLMPVLMTAINIVSGMIYTKGAPLKSKLQLYGMALIFLVLLYDSPSGLVLYWTLNNLFSLGKNIFYKLKNPILVLGITCFTVGCFLMPYVIIKPMLTIKKQLFVILCLTPLFLILPGYLLKKKFGSRLFKSRPVSSSEKSDNVLFITCCIFLALLTGVLIPSAVINSSPAEFVNRMYFQSPLNYVGVSFAIATGTFVLWLNIYYFLLSQKVRRVFALIASVLAGWAVVNYLFFGQNYGNMSSMLQYDNIINSASLDYLLNTAILAALTAIIWLLWKKWPVFLRSVTSAMSAAILIMSCLNVFSINRQVNKISASLDSLSNTEGVSLPLDKSGKNVVVIMMDRAICEFFPYIIEEKPELKEQLAGFTYYPNTIAYGSTTLVASPCLFGGYEYTPENINKRNNESLKDKQTEALKLMPVIFSDNGYEVTVCDPPFAGFDVFVDLNIYNDYPQINRYITKNLFSDGTDFEITRELLNRNFFAYSLMRVSPSLFHLSLYNNGRYNHLSRSSVQVPDGLYKAAGGTASNTSDFIGSYNVLKKLPELTDVTDTGKNTFLMLENDSTHDTIMLQEPEYEPSEHVDNTAYESEHGTRIAADGSEMNFTTRKQIKHYQCNVASLLRLGDWMDYLRENDLYDNTRIIIVSDHGKDLDFLFGDAITDGADKIPSDDVRINFSDIMAYKPLMLVKDFDSNEPVATDNTFMTNADTPTLAFEGLINDPINPFTGKSINSDAKNKEKEHHIAGTTLWNPTDYSEGETTLKQLKWVGLTGNDTSDLSAWRGIGDSPD